MTEQHAHRMEPGAEAGPGIEAIWQRLKQAADRCDDQLRLMTLSTVDQHGRPAGRLMVLRGASTSMQRIWFYTTTPSVKVDEIAARPDVCMIGYDAVDLVQVVLRGRATVHTDSPLADDHWDQFRTAAGVMREQPEGGSCRQAAADPRLRAMMQTLDGGEGTLSRESFALIEVCINSIEWVAIEAAGIQRAVYELPEYDAGGAPGSAAAAASHDRPVIEDGR